MMIFVLCGPSSTIDTFGNVLIEINLLNKYFVFQATRQYQAHGKPRAAQVELAGANLGVSAASDKDF